MAHDITFTFRGHRGHCACVRHHEDDGLPVESEGEYGGENKDGSKEEDEDEIDDGITGETQTTKWRLHDKNHNHDLCLGSDSYTLHSLKRRTDQEKIA